MASIKPEPVAVIISSDGEGSPSSGFIVYRNCICLKPLDYIYIIELNTPLDGKSAAFMLILPRKEKTGAAMHFLHTSSFFNKS